MLERKRFSKEKVKAWLAVNMLRLERNFGFDPSNGTAQLKGRDMAACVAYGQYDTYRRILEEIDGEYL